jgi:hypothetical protein
VTHDGEGHIARITNYASALKQGQFPPRFAPSFWNGFGYPVFNFHYPLLNMIGAPFVVVGSNPQLVFKIIILVAWMSLWLGIYFYILQLTKQKIAALLSMLVCMLGPYFYTLIYIRGAYGELLACAACIWLLCIVEWRRENESKLLISSIGVTLLSAAVLLAHNIYAVLLFPLSLLYALVRKRNASSVWSVACECMLGFGISAFFWIPTLAEKKYIVLDDLLDTQYLEHFSTLLQLFNSNVTNGISILGPNDSLSLGIGFVGLSVLIAAIVYLLLESLGRYKRTSNYLGILSLLVFAVLCIFVQLPVSQVVWKYILVLPYFQFPWRFLGPLTITLAILGGLLWKTKYKPVQLILGLGIIAHAVYVPHWYWPQFANFATAYYLNYPLTSTVSDELRPKTFSMEPWIVSSNKPEIHGAGQVSNLKWRGTYRTYTVSAQEAVTVVEPTMYFPGWKVWANTTSVALIGDTTGTEAVKTYKGQVAFTLPAGNWEVHSKMTQQTPARIVGNSLSILSMGIVFWRVSGTMHYSSKRLYKR